VSLYEISPNILRCVACLAIVMTLLAGGCSYTLHERKPDSENPADQGSTTEVGLKGPKAAVSHKF